MDSELIKTINDGPWTFGRWQDFSTMITWIDARGISIEDILEYIQIRRSAMIANEEAMSSEAEMRSFKTPVDSLPLDRYAPKICDECKAPMLLYSVNTSIKDQTGDDSKSVYICTNKNCMETIYNKESRETLKRRRYANG